MGSPVSELGVTTPIVRVTGAAEGSGNEVVELAGESAGGERVNGNGGGRDGHVEMDAGSGAGAGSGRNYAGN